MLWNCTLVRAIIIVPFYVHAFGVFNVILIRTYFTKVILIHIQHKCFIILSKNIMQTASLFQVSHHMNSISNEEPENSFFESSLYDSPQNDLNGSQASNTDPLQTNYIGPDICASSENCDLSLLLKDDDNSEDILSFEKILSMDSYGEATTSTNSGRSPDDIFSNDFLSRKLPDIIVDDKDIPAFLTDDSNFFLKDYHSVFDDHHHEQKRDFQKPIITPGRTGHSFLGQMTSQSIPNKPLLRAPVQKTIAIEGIRKDDVLFGRGKRTTNHMGNKYFRELVSCMSPKYKGCSKVQKTSLSNSIVAAIHKKGGRFLSPMPNDCNSWVEMRGLALRRKTSQALRDCRVYRQNRK